MRFVKSHWLVAMLGCGLLAFGSSPQASKTLDPNIKNPFASKMKRENPGLAQPERRRAFEQELAQLPAKISAARTGALQKPASSSRELALARLSSLSGGSLKISWNENGSLPIFIKGYRLQENKLEQAQAASDAALSQQALAFLQENADLFRLQNPAQEFQVLTVQREASGMTHIHYQQAYQGLEVWGRDIWMHLDRNGVVESFNGRYSATPTSVAVNDLHVNQARAEQIARQAFGIPADAISSRLLIFIDENETPHAAWLVNLKKGLDGNWHYFVAAQTGAILKQYNHIMFDGPVTGSGTDLLGASRNLNLYQIGANYLMIDASKPMFNAAQSQIPDDGKGVIYVFDARNGEGEQLYYVVSNNPNSWPDRSSVSASANGALVYDYYNQVHGRNAIDGAGSTMNIAINFKQDFNNAFWNGQFMVFGNGDGNRFGQLAAALDVTAHEMSHGVVERTANLVYENQPGALNESFADVFGVLFEFWVEGNGGDWLIGEDVTTPGTPGDALRDMANPASNLVAFSKQPTKMSEFQNLPNTEEGDNGGVHINSGIPNRAFYLFATNSGLEAAEKVYYRALSTYLTRNAQFIDCRLAVIKAAEDLYGVGSAQATAAGQAFDGVEIFSGESTPPPPVQPPVEGTEYLAVIDAGSGQLYRTSTSGQQITQISNTGLRSRTSVSDDGGDIFYVDTNGNIHLLASDGSSDQTITGSGGFNNIAISPNGRWLAVTSTFLEAVIYVADLASPSPSLAPVQLYTPTSAQGEETGNILYPDRIDWSSDNAVLMYDAFNIYVNASGDTTSYWDINLLRAADGKINRLFPPQRPGVNIGNAVFASNTDNIIAFDFFDETGAVKAIAVNLNTGEQGVITNNGSSLSSPSFSRDDQRVYYHYIENNSASVWYADLLPDGLTGNGNDAQILNGGVYPVSFTVGQRPTGVESHDPVLPAAFALEQNYPNPFNPETAIRYSLPEAGNVALAVFDVNGRRVATLESGMKPAGAHAVRWNGLDDAGKRVTSGIYFYRLTATAANGGVQTMTKKMTILK